MTDAELARFFLSLVLVLAAAMGSGRLFERMKLPRVIGEIAGGLLLGPSVLGLVSAEGGGANRGGGLGAARPDRRSSFRETELGY